MKKLFISFLFFLFLTLDFRLLGFSSTLARDPIIIEDSTYGPPVGTGQDYNYHSNDIEHTDTVDCTENIAISQTRNIDAPSGTPTPPPTTINVDYQFTDDSNYTNQSPLNAESHLVGNQKVIYGDDDSIDKAFLCLDASCPSGASGMTNRILTFPVQQCLKARRLVRAIVSHFPNTNVIENDDQIGWNCPGMGKEIYSILEKKDGHGCTPIRQSDIAASLASESIFYGPTQDCNQNPLPDPQPLSGIVDISTFRTYPVSPDIAASLFNTSINVITNNSVASAVKLCANGSTSDCQTTSQSIPAAGSGLVNADIVRQGLVYHQPIPHKDLCTVSNRPISVDRPNPVTNILKLVLNAVGQAAANVQTYTGSVTRTYSIDSRVNPDYDTAFVNNFITAKEQAKNNTNDPAGSTTDGKVIHPGNPVAREVFQKNFLPF